MAAVNGAYGADDLVVRPAGDTIAAFSSALEALAASARARGLTCTPVHRVAASPALGEAFGCNPTDTCRPGPTARSPGSCTAPGSRMPCRPARRPN